VTRGEVELVAAGWAPGRADAIPNAVPIVKRAATTKIGPAILRLLNLANLFNSTPT